jgi:UDP-N-acetylglucosamine--N-acetylmuramyl-(pentapeptide) pyrophosphoryl-undecaprenol N-acetylglucosamine transferase
VRIVVGAGGTGGHIYPGLAVADAIRRLVPDAEVTFIGTPRGLEQRLIPPAGYALELVDMAPWRGVRGAPGFAWATVRATAQALWRVRCDAVVAMGGYPSLPTVIAARLRGIPVVIHESGAIGGRANRVAARFTRNVALSFASAAASFPRRTPRVVGMPLNPDNITGKPDAFGGFHPIVFITGGSQGSVRLNDLAVGLGERWRGRSDVRVVLKTGRDHSVAATADVVEAHNYFDSMGDVYASVDVVVSRAGASTVAELATCGLPSILVPYPHALDNDQEHNAKVLTDVGAAVVVRDADATADAIGPMLEDWITHPETLAKMAASARTVGHADAATTLAEWVIDLAT